MPRPLQVRAMPNYYIWLAYDDGTQGEVNLSHLSGKGVFNAWQKEVDFQNVYIDKETDAIAWNETLELCPNSLYLKIKGMTFEEWKEVQLVHATDF
ncbi:MAG: DUF2442 domain-containing protein [Ignavibacteriae bacterium]|nr:DUF2442 domain-containing protein [Ignavibacteriota bacterium]